ncbi:MAG: aminotransferase class V-fold PLP-dependent enzyme [Pseudolabrys sp.]
MHWADARDAIERARSEVASLVGAFADEIVFTSGGTEASNIAIRGDVTMEPARRAVVTTNIEHPATEACSDLLERAGHPVSRGRRKPMVASIRLPWRRQPPMTQRL